MKWPTLRDILSTAITSTLANEDVRQLLRNNRPEVDLYDYFQKDLTAALSSFYSGPVQYKVDVRPRLMPCGSGKLVSMPHDNAIGIEERRAEPDIVIHVPGIDAENLLAIEIKKTTEIDRHQLFHAQTKLAAYVSRDRENSPTGDRGYKYGLYLRFAASTEPSLTEALLLPRRAFEALSRRVRLEGRQEMGRIGKRLLLGGADVTGNELADLKSIQQALGYRCVRAELAYIPPIVVLPSVQLPLWSQTTLD